MEMISLNENLYDEFFVQELESRLETDPLGVNSLMNLFDSPFTSDYCGDIFCSPWGSTCGEFCQGGYY